MSRSSLKMRRWALSALLISIGSASLLSAQADGSGNKRFTVRASIVPDSLDSSDYQKRGMFWAETTVTNVSGINQEVVVWTQYGWSWLSNNEAVQPGIEATQNIATRSVLRPGQKYVARLELFASPRSRRPLTFRLGFYPTPERPIAGLKSAINQGVFWSEDVVLDR